MLDRQSVFNTVIAGFQSQDWQPSLAAPFYDDEYNEWVHPDDCVYRGPNNTRCAIGWLIPDDQYNPRWDQMVYGYNELPLDVRVNVLGASTPEDEEFYIELQRAHDLCNGDLRSAMERFAKQYGLEFPANA